MTVQELELPKGWTKSELGDFSISEIIMGQSPPGSTYNKGKNGLTFFQGKKDFGEKFPMPTIWCSMPKRLAEKGDILLCVRAPVGKINWANEKCCIGRGLSAIRPNIESRFVYYFLKSIETNLAVSGAGSTFNAINKNELYKISIPVSPLNEQKRIVSKIEELFSKTDSAKQSLEHAKLQLEEYRLSLLKSIFEGRLTKKWRDVNKNEVQNKFQKYKEIDSELKEEIGILHGENLPTIPPNWFWARIKKISETGQGGTPSRAKEEFWNGPIPWVRSGEVRNNIIETTNEAITQLGVDKSSTKKCQVGTVLLAMTGEGITRGRAAILGIEACANQSVCHMIVNRDLILNKYLFYYFQTYYWKIRRLDKGAGQPGLNVSMVREFEVPICSLKEQHEIVKIIEKSLNNIDNSYTNIKLGLNELEILQKSILKQAFEGNLVPQDPNDEPASVLLERIKKEKIKP